MCDSLSLEESPIQPPAACGTSLKSEPKMPKRFRKSRRTWQETYHEGESIGVPSRSRRLLLAMPVELQLHTLTILNAIHIISLFVKATTAYNLALYSNYNQ